MDSTKIKKLGVGFGTGLATIGAAAPLALAEGEPSAVTTALTTMATSVATEGTATVSAVLPAVTPLLAMIIVIGVGLRVIKKVTGR